MALERMGDHAEDLAEAAQERFNPGVPFSDRARQDLAHAFDDVQATPGSALLALSSNDRALAQQVRLTQDEMDRIARATDTWSASATIRTTSQRASRTGTARACLPRTRSRRRLAAKNPSFGAGQAALPSAILQSQPKDHRCRPAATGHGVDG